MRTSSAILAGSLPEGFERAPILPAAGFGVPSPAVDDVEARW
jgi:hypothetical protein